MAGGSTSPGLSLCSLCHINKDLAVISNMMAFSKVPGFQAPKSTLIEIVIMALIRQEYI